MPQCVLMKYRSELLNRISQSSIHCQAGFVLTLASSEDHVALGQAELERPISTILRAFWQNYKPPTTVTTQNGKMYGRPQARGVDWLDIGALMNISRAHEDALSSSGLSLASILIMLAKHSSAAMLDSYRSFWLHLAMSIVGKRVPSVWLDDSTPMEACITLIHNIIVRYVALQIGQEPKPPSNWSHPTKRACCLPGCQDCTAVNTFLACPTEKVRGWAINEQRRGHLDRYFSACDPESSFEVTVIKDKSPFTWQMTKNTKHYESQHKILLQRVAIGKQQMYQLDGKTSRLQPFLQETIHS